MIKNYFVHIEALEMTFELKSKITMGKKIRPIMANCCVLICRLYGRWGLVRVALLRWNLDILFTIRHYILTAENPQKEHRQK